MGAFVDLTGKTFVRLTVLERGPNGRHGHARWWCVCQCGTKRLIHATNLLAKHPTQSCGCLDKEQRRERRLPNPPHRRPEYRIWCKMKERCLNPKNSQWKHYGGRGITVDEAWKHSFEAFYASIGPRPSPAHSIERIDNNQGYTPTNTMWATSDIQSRNKRNNHVITIDGHTAILQDWLLTIGIGDSTYRQRRNAGLSVVEALTRPKRFQRSKKKA